MNDFRKRLVLCAVIIFFWKIDIFATPSRTHTFILTPAVTYYHFDHHWHLENRVMPALGIGYGFNRRVSAELFFIDISSKNNMNHSVHGISCTLGGLYHFRPEKRLQPYVLAGIGLTYLHPHQALETASQVHLNMGAGLKYFVSDRIALRTDVCDVYTTLNSKQDVVFGFGIGFLFGEE